VQMLAPSLSKFAPLGVRELEVFDLPYLFDGYDQLHKVTQGAVGKSLFERLQSKGIVGLAYWDNGFKSFSANRPLHVPEDFNDLKMRIQSSRVLYAQMRALGAIPKVLAFSEVYQALRSGEVDGTENPHSNLYTQRMYEVQKHMTLSNHGYVGYAVVVNRKFWDGLPTDIRDGLTQAMEEATREANDNAKQDNASALEKIRATGKINIHMPTEEQKAALKSALIPVHQEMSARIGEGTIQAIYKETGFDPNKPQTATR
jgi:C4-dicarboxylate-binding protein DctP